MYTAPNVIFSPSADTITATSQADPTKSASMSVSLQTSTSPQLLSATPNGISSNRAVFVFTVGSCAGINSIEPFFTAGPNYYGPNNGTNPCHMKYFLPSNTIYLDGDTGGSTWNAGSTTLGSGGANLSNSFCTVHASSSQVQVNGSQVVLSVDVEFPSVPQTMFLAADDVQGAVANFQWFGWWPQ